jgi:hypothetical protein
MGSNITDAVMVLSIAFAIMGASINRRIQHRKAWEAYYARPTDDGEQHKTPYSQKTEEVKSDG